MRTISTPSDSLRFDGAADRWFDALPIGNGRLGGMVFHALARDRIQLSESTAWSGGPAEHDVNPGARANLDRIRQALFAGEHDEAHRLTEEHLLGRPTSFGTNLPLPEVRVDFDGEASEVARVLDIGRAIASGRALRGGVRLTSETFSSRPDGVLVHRLDADGAFSARISVSETVFPQRTTVEGETLVLTGRAVETLHSDGVQGVPLSIRVRVIVDGGSIAADGAGLRVADATSLTLLIAVGTGWDDADEIRDAAQSIAGAVAHGYAELRERHVADHRELYDRVSIDLGETPEPVRSAPIDERRRRYAEGGEDLELEALYFRYGRYLTIAGSRHDSPLPLALQGLWNDGLASSAPWTNDFHLDMNTQQNYWAAEVTDLGETQEPLLRFVERLSRTGRATAREMYGANGWVAHTVSNAWGYSAPGWGMGWGMCLIGGAWIALQHWERWDYGRDVDFLRERAYPVLKGAAEFFLDHMVEHPESGWLVTGPSDSPENWYLSETGRQCAVSMGPTGDRVFVEAVLRMVTEAAGVLGVDEEFAARAQQARERLAPFRIGRHGQLQEWLEDFEEAVPSHRHTSHLMGLFPERQIVPRRDPELARACEVVIERREAAPGWEQTEWAEANLIAYYARLLNGDTALVHVRNLIADASESNLMSYSQGGVAGAAQNIYSFDGNAGGTAGIAEMLLQSDGEEIELLPALPSSWRQGSVTGLRARNRVRVDLHWADGGLDHAVLRSDRDAQVRVRVGDDVTSVSLRAGEPTVIRPVHDGLAVEG